MEAKAYTVTVVAGIEFRREYGDEPERSVATFESCEAAETLEDARRLVGEAIVVECQKAADGADDPAWDAFDRAHLVPVSGGTVGPLPNGTVIEVAAVTWRQLAHEGGLIAVDHPQLWPLDKLVARFNEMQGRVVA